MKISRRSFITRFLTLVITVIIYLTSYSFHAWSYHDEQYAIIINLAGKQRMLTQKMVKEELLIYAGIAPEENRERLRQTVDLFVKTLDGLREGDNSLGLPPTEVPHIRTQIDTVKVLFKQVEPILRRILAGESPTGDATLELVQKSAYILQNMNIAVEMFEQAARNVMKGDETFLGVEINLAGKQRMLTQKMAKEALLIYLQIDSQENKKALRQTATLFDKILYGLKYGDGELGLPGTQEESIRVQLDVVIDIWNRFRPVIGKSYDIIVDRISEDDLTQMVNLSILLLDKMSEVVKMYEASTK